MSSLHKEWKGNGRRKTESETNCREGKKKLRRKRKDKENSTKRKESKRESMRNVNKKKNLTKSKSIFILYRIFIKNNNCIKYSKLKIL